MRSVWEVGRTAVGVGFSALRPLYSIAADLVGRTPAGPVVEKAVHAGERVVEPLISAVRGERSEPTPDSEQPDVVRPARTERPDAVRPARTERPDAVRPARAERRLELAPDEAPLTDLPLPTYEAMELPAILDALNGLTVTELHVVRDYEAENENRLPILDRIDDLLASVDATP